MLLIIETLKIQNHCRKVKATSEQGKEDKEKEERCDIIVHREERKVSSLFDVLYRSPTYWCVETDLAIVYFVAMRSNLTKILGTLYSREL